MIPPKGLIIVTVLAICASGTEGDQKCAMNFGFCQNVDVSCSGNYIAYLCDGPYTRKCCVPAFYDEKCNGKGGKCQSTSIPCFGGRYFTGLCGGPQGRRCCVSNVTDSAYNDEKCHKFGGTCAYTTITCVGGTYVSGLCEGPVNRRCCLPDVKAHPDDKCHAIGGLCQNDTIVCAGGSYVSGLCSGSADRRCCVRHATGNAAITTTTTTTTSTTTTATTTTTTATAAACGERRKQLACEVVQSDNVGFLEVPGVTSPDKPYHVLNDMCQGRRAVRSKDRCDSGCKDANGTVCLRTTLLEYLVNLKNNGRIVIKELTGACHRNGCSHQWGKAVDLHRDGRTMEYISMCQLMGGTVFPLADDIHCHF